MNWESKEGKDTLSWFWYGFFIIFMLVVVTLKTVTLVTVLLVTVSGDGFAGDGFGGDGFAGGLLVTVKLGGTLGRFRW